MGRFVLLKEEQPEAGRAFGARARVSQSAVRGSPEERTVCGEVERPAPSGAGASSPVRFEGVASHAGEAVSGPPSSLVRIDSHPPPSRLRVFGGLWLVFFALCGAIAGKATGSVWPAAWLWMVAAAVPAVGWTVPGSVRLVYLAVAYASYPFSCALSHLILAGVYYLVLTPIGLLLRLLGYDPMARRPDTEARSYWRRPRRAEHIEGYFRQY
jgi:hypothetical protein